MSGSLDVCLSVLTLNCWGLLVSDHRKDRFRAIGQCVKEASPGYDIVGLQEVWERQDYVLVRDIVKDVLPYSMYWTSGLYGSGLATFSKYPIVSTSLNRFALNGDPWPVWQGDWYDGKSCGSVVVVHPLIGEIEVFNTHYHATYDQVGTDDRYLGTRVSQAWEMSKLLRQSIKLGRRVLALGDFNSPPQSLAISLLTHYGGVTDSWGSLHPLPDPLPDNLTPEQGIALLGVTCDTPLNSWTSNSKWLNDITKTPIGERLDYILYNASSHFKCLGSEVVLREKVSGLGFPRSMMRNLSDHYGLHSVFSIAVDTAAAMIPTSLFSSQTRALDVCDDKTMLELLERILTTLQQHSDRIQLKSKRMIYIVSPFVAFLTVALIIASFWSNNWPRWAILLATMGVSMLTFVSVGCFSYGFFYGGESISAFTNVVREVQLAVDNCYNEQNGNSRVIVIKSTYHDQHHGPLSEDISTRGSIRL